MNVHGLRIGSLIKISPRENQEGLLAVAEIQKETLIGEMLEPRQGYLFRIKFDEIIQIPITEEWLEKTGFSKDPAGGHRWIDGRGLLDFDFSRKQFYKDGLIPSKAVNFVHELQNGYFFLTGEEVRVG